MQISDCRPNRYKLFRVYLGFLVSGRQQLEAFLAGHSEEETGRNLNRGNNNTRIYARVVFGRQRTANADTQSDTTSRGTRSTRAREQHR